MSTQENGVIELRGCKVVLVKESIKEGCTSKVKPGKVQKLKIAQNVRVGYPLMKVRTSGLSDTERSSPATTTIIGIAPVNESHEIYSIETNTSVYTIQKL